MAEAATVIQLVQFSGLVLSCCYEYITKAKDAPREIQKVLDEVTSLEGILKNLKPLAEAPGDDRFVILKSLNRTGGPFEACSTALKEIDKKLRTLNELSNVRRKLQWPLEAGKIEATIQKLGEHKISFILALAGQSAIDDELMKKAIDDTKSTVDDIQAKQLHDRILAWLQGADPSTNHNAAQKKKESGTCEWLISSKQFQSFIEGENQLMWLHGIPGAGKTVLNSTVIDHISASADLGEKKVIYYYFDFNDHAKQTCFGFLQSLVRQICSQSNTAPADIVKLHAECNGASPTLEQLIETLISLLSQESTVYIIIDALDECKEEEDEEERRAVLDALRDIKSSATGPFNIFVASRPEIDIAREMSDLCDIDLDVQAALVDEDIRCHVRSCLAKDARLKRWPPNVKKEIEDKLTNDANGMFRWVVCQLAELRKCLKLANLRLELGNLPKTLDATYTRILKNVPSIHQREMRMILEFLTFSTRPMTLQEVAEATTVNLEKQVFDIDDRFPDPYDLLAVCSSLVSVSPISQDPQSPIRREGPYRFSHHRMPSDLRMLQFAHFSVKEYILSERARQTLPSDFVIGETLSHSHITQACLIYLLDFSNGKKISSFKHEEFPFLAYAALNWTTHLASTTADERELIDALLVRLFDPEHEHHLMNYLNLYEPDRPSHLTSQSEKGLSMGMASRNKRDFQPPIYYACYHGLGMVVKYLLSGDEKTRPDKEVMGSGLAAAASQGFSDTVELLLKQGADPNSPYCGKFWRPLHAAASSGNPRVVKQLLDAGSFVNSQSGSDGAALNVAAEQGNPEVVQLLIDHGAQLYPSSEYHGPPLSAAALGQNEEAVKVLVRNKVDVNIPPDGYLNPLNLACTECSVDIVRLLLDNGAEAALKPIWSRALHNACERGAIDIMQLLLDRGADINGDTNGVYTTPLKAAIQANGRDIEVFEFMLRNGADINFKGSGIKYPLDQALFGGNLKAAERLIELGAEFGDEGLEDALGYDTKESLVKMLIDRGANVNAEHHRYGNILQFAVLQSSATAVRWLLEAGSDPNDVPDGEYGTPLQAAAYRGKENLVRLLLEYGASVNPPRPSGQFGFPLHAAIRKKEEAIIELLLDHGAGMNVSGGKKSGTPLQIAAGAGLEKVVKSLIAKGAEINPRPSGEYGTPIRAALANNHEEIVKFLLENNADIIREFKVNHYTTRSNVTETYSSSLEVAAASYNPKLVQLLLDHGLEINSNGRACSRALVRASESQESTMLEFLISKGADIKSYGGAALTLSINRYDHTRIRKTQLLLKHGADPNGDPSAGMTPLSSSIYHEHPEVTKLLLDSGCDVNATYSKKYRNGSALHEAIDKVAIDVVKDIISRGADVNLRAGPRGTPLATAIMKGEEEVFRLLLEHGAEVDPKIPYGYYGTPLHSAIQKNYYEMANELLDRGANPNAPGWHASPLTGACGWGKTGQIDLIERLLSAGADIEAEDKPRPEDDNLPGTRFYLTPLQYAVYAGKERIVELLLERGAKINPSSPKGTYGSPLQAAVKNKNESMVKFLLERGADINAVGGKFGTALQAAAEEGSDALVNLLLEAGADHMLEGGYYGSPLQAASRIGKDRHVKLFLDRGAAINTNVGKYGNPLAAACKRAERSTVEILIAGGANVNQSGGKYGYPLQAACSATGSTAKKQAGSVVKILLEKGADVNAEGGKYGTALQAAAYHDRRYVQILLEHGADPNIRGGKFGSALSAARKKGFLRVEKLLLDHGAVNEDIGAESEAS